MIVTDCVGSCVDCFKEGFYWILLELIVDLWKEEIVDYAVACYCCRHFCSLSAFLLYHWFETLSILMRFLRVFPSASTVS